MAPLKINFWLHHWPKPNKHATTLYRLDLTNPKPTITPQFILIGTYKPKPNKCYSYLWIRRGDLYPPVLISMANQRWLSRLGRWSFFLVQACLCFLSFSSILLSFLFLIPRATPFLVLRLWFLSWRRRRKKEVESGVFGFSDQELEIYKLNFPPRNRVFKTQFASIIESNKLEILVC